MNKRDHRSLTLWAAKCAARVLPYFEKEFADDVRPRKAIEAARGWARRKMTVDEARTAAFAAHAAARDAGRVTARAVARSAAHAAATAQEPEHARHAATYARTAVGNTTSSKHALEAMTRERQWQLEQLLERLRPLISGRRVGD